MTEIWKSVVDWPLYEVSSEGRIRRAAAGKGTRTGKVLKWQWGTKGYWHVTLSRGDGTQLSIGINIIVCRAFHGEPPQDGMHAAHENGDRSENTARNLYWATPTQNAADRVRHGTHNKGSRNHQSRLTEGDIPEIRRLAAEISQAHAAKKFNVSAATVSLIVNRKYWSHVA